MHVPLLSCFPSLGGKKCSVKRLAAGGHQSPEAAPNLDGCAVLSFHMQPSARVHSWKQTHSLTLTRLLPEVQMSKLWGIPVYIPKQAWAQARPTFVDTCMPSTFGVT